MSYDSAHWRSLRQRAFARSKGICEGCGVPLESGAWHLHHLTYQRKGAELLSDVRAICLNCHRIKHPKREFRSVAAQKAIAKARWLKAKGKAARQEIERQKAIRRSRKRHDPHISRGQAVKMRRAEEGELNWKAAMERDR